MARMWGSIIGCAAMLAAGGCVAAERQAGSATATALNSRFSYSDVLAFYRIHDAAAGRPDAATLQRDYIDPGTPGLRGFIPSRIMSGERLAQAVAANPAVYAQARRCLDLMPRIQALFENDMRRFLRLYPQATIPSVTMVIGRNNSGGTATDAGVIIGVEVACRVDSPSARPLDQRVRHLVAHEIAHASQSSRPARHLLDIALREGVPELVAELISGDILNDHLKLWTRGREAEIERDFRTNMRSNDPAVARRWVYNGVGTREQPGDLAYWVGYRIARAYYRRAGDKKAALRRLLTDPDSEAILRDSGWSEGA